MIVEVKKTFELTDDDITDIVVTALEGGIGYWACLDNSGPEYMDAPEDETVSETVARLLLNGEEVHFFDNEDDGTTYVITLDAIKEAIQQYIEEGYDAYSNAFAGMVPEIEQVDANVADIIFQLAIFKEVVFG